MVIDMDVQDAGGAAHVVAAVAALASGLGVLAAPKGTSAHRSLGAVYVLALVLVNLAALSVYRDGTFGVFHGLAIASLATLVAGATTMRLAKGSPGAVRRHAFCMTWSYAGLVAAGCGQLAAAPGGDSPGWLVPVAIATVLGLGGVVIFARVPKILRQLT